MAANFKHNGRRVLINSASGTGILTGAVTAQEGFFGVALTSPASGAAFWLAIEGVWNVAVPASTVKGDFLFIPGAGGAVTEATVPAMTRTNANTNTPIVKALTDRSAAGFADVLILAQGAAISAKQV